MEAAEADRDLPGPGDTGANGTDRPLKVIFTTPFGERRGGSESMLWTILRSIDRSRIEPMVVFFTAGTFPHEVEELGIRTLVLESGRFRNIAQGIRCVTQLASVLRRERPDLLVNWLNRAHLYGAVAALLAGMPGRAMWWQHRLAGDIGLSRVATLLPTRAVGTSSHGVATAQRQLWPHRRTLTVHPGIEPPQTRPPAALEELREELHIPAGRQVVGIVGRLVAWKGHGLLAEAVGELRGRGHDVHALMVGGAHEEDPGYESELRRHVDELGLSNAITFTGQVGDPVPLIQLMDVFVSASDDEPFGLVLVEAMALGTPVVARDGAGPREIIEPGSSGVIVAGGDASALADAIAPLLDDPALRERLGEGGRKRYRERFTAARMADDIAAELRALARH